MLPVEAKLVDVEELKYLSTDVIDGVEVPRGEICLRGPIVMSEYFKNPDKTAEALDEEGWLHTGDIGAIQPNGALKVIDRKKNIFKLQQGEYVAPEKLEAIYVNSPYIAQIFIHGDSL
jgi:long-chain acyl-CoA synthetase